MTPLNISIGVVRCINSITEQRGFKMADDADIANDRIEQDLQLRINAARGVVSSQGDPKQGTDDCIECGLEIPSARQIAIPGVDTCVHCAEVAERKSGMFR